MKLTIGITGIGGDIGLGILNSLKRSKYKNAKTIGMDINPYSVGLYKADKGYIIPRVDSSKYLSKLVKICNQEKINALFISTEQELSYLSKARKTFEKKTQTKLIIADPNIIEIGLDKWKTHQFLKENNFLYPQSILVKNNTREIKQFIKRVGFPLVIKPRKGRGTKNIHLIKSSEELEFYKKRINQPILQEYLRPNTEEYTCGVFAYNGKVFVIVFKRELAYGLTFKAVVWKDKEIEAVCQRIAKLLKLEGSINVQLRKTKKGPVPFEVNPRYSSTTSIRNYLGFRDVEWAVDVFISGRKNIKYCQPLKGTVIMRYFEEFYPKEKPKSPVKFFNL